MAKEDQYSNPYYDDNPIVRISVDFTLVAIEYCEVLESMGKRVIAYQLLKSASSVGANIMEAQSPESTADFVHKLKIASKELLETEYWLMVVSKSPSYPNPEALLQLLPHLRKLLFKILSTTKSRMR